MAEKLGATVHDRATPDKSLGAVPDHSAHHSRPAVLGGDDAGHLAGRVCTDTGIYYQGGVEMPLLSMYTRGLRFVTGRVNARAVIPKSSNCSRRIAISHQQWTGWSTGRTPRTHGRR